MPGKYPYTGPRGDDIPICGDCGQRHATHWDTQACTGHVVFDRTNYVRGQERPRLVQPRPCEVAPMYGQDVCYRHGGAARQTRTAGEQRMAEQRAEVLAARWAIPVDTTPTEAILGRVSAFAGHVKFYAEKVAELDDADLVWGVTKETDGHVVVGNGPDAYVDANTDQVREAKPNAWLTLYNEASEKLVRFAAEALKAGIEERRVRLAESQGALVADVLRAVAARLNLTPEQTALFATVAPEELRKLAPVA